MAGVDAIIHAATNSPAARRGRFKLGDLFSSPADVDVDGTQALLAAAERVGVDRPSDRVLLAAGANVRQDGAVRHVVLNRLGKRNAMNRELLLELGATLRQAAADSEVHCVVLRGEGPAFSAGVSTRLPAVVGPAGPRS